MVTLWGNYEGISQRSVEIHEKVIGAFIEKHMFY
ncbi:hypothetical protein CI674_018895 [Escherichia coli]|nr:hypothetical protein CI674_018895 [Escherichia coli]